MQLNSHPLITNSLSRLWVIWAVVLGLLVGQVCLVQAFKEHIHVSPINGIIRLFFYGITFLIIIGICFLKRYYLPKGIARESFVQINEKNIRLTVSKYQSVTIFSFALVWSISLFGFFWFLSNGDLQLSLNLACLSILLLLFIRPNRDELIKLVKKQATTIGYY